MIYPLKFRFLLSLAILLFFGSQAIAQSTNCEEIQVSKLKWFTLPKEMQMEKFTSRLPNLILNF